MGIESIQANGKQMSAYQATGNQAKVDRSVASAEVAVTQKSIAVSAPVGKRESPVTGIVKAKKDSLKSEEGKTQTTGMETVKDIQPKAEQDIRTNQNHTERKAEESKNKSEIDRAGTSAKFSYNKDINRIVITITDNGKDKVLKEIPSEDTQKMLARVHEMTGMVMDQEI